MKYFVCIHSVYSLILFLSESGFTGFKDLQDSMKYFVCIHSVYSLILFCLNQDLQDLRIYRI